MNKYYEHLQAAVRFFWWLIGFSQLKAATKQFKYFNSRCERLLICPADRQSAKNTLRF